MTVTASIWDSVEYYRQRTPKDEAKRKSIHHIFQTTAARIIHDGCILQIGTTYRELDANRVAHMLVRCGAKCMLPQKSMPSYEWGTIVGFAKYLAKRRPDRKTSDHRVKISATTYKAIVKHGR